MEILGVPDASADVIISNGVINLAEDKHSVLSELFRVLRPGGRLQIADMVRTPSAENAGCGDGEESWADCVSGTLEPEVFLSMLSHAGFTDVVLTGFTGYKTAASTVGALTKAMKPG